MPEVEDRREQEARETAAQIRIELERVSEATLAEIQERMQASFAAVEAATERVMMQRAIAMVAAARQREHEFPSWIIVALASVITVGVGAGTLLLAPNRSTAVFILFGLMIAAGLAAFTLSIASAHRTTS